MITIEFEVTKETHTFKDAIILPKNHGLSDDEINKIKQQRFDEWYSIVTQEDGVIDNG